MEKQIKITIMGKPIAKARPRFYRRGKFVGTYNAQQTEEGRFLLEATQQLDGHGIIEGPVSLYAVFYMPIPKTTPKCKVSLMIENELKHVKKPHCDNLLKFVKDCLNGIVWKDDSQVYDIRAVKRYSTHPKTEIFIQPN